MSPILLFTVYYLLRASGSVTINLRAPYIAIYYCPIVLKWAGIR